MELSERQKKGLKKSNETNTLKGLRTFIKSAYSKQDKIFNDMIDDLIKTGFYKNLYSKFTNPDYDLNEMETKEYKILELFDFCEPDDLHTKYRGFHIVKLNGIV